MYARSDSPVHDGGLDPPIPPRLPHPGNLPNETDSQDGKTPADDEGIASLARLAQRGTFAEINWTDEKDKDGAVRTCSLYMYMCSKTFLPVTALSAGPTEVPGWRLGPCGTLRHPAAVAVGGTVVLMTPLSILLQIPIKARKGVS
eukprot:SAG22_NODE_864_length_6788_cov_2.700553_4_plen_145_part_00